MWLIRVISGALCHRTVRSDLASVGFGHQRTVSWQDQRSWSLSGLSNVFSLTDRRPHRLEGDDVASCHPLISMDNGAEPRSTDGTRSNTYA